MIRSENVMKEPVIRGPNLSFSRVRGEYVREHVTEELMFLQVPEREARMN